MNFLDFAIKTAQKAGELTVKKSKKPFRITEKNKKDLVTAVDLATEKLILKEIHSTYPSHAILAEESSFKAKGTPSPEDFFNSKYVWIIDPIDGTTNFAHGLRQYAVSMALMETNSIKRGKNFDYLEGEIIVGVTFAPKLDELFHAQKGKGAYMNGKRIHVTKNTKLSNALTATGFPPKNRETNIPYLMQMMEKSRAVRRMGAATLDMAYTACGIFDGFWEFELSPWDIAAGSLLIEEAGGRVTDTNGNQLDLFGRDILATNGKIHRQMINSFREI